MPDRNSSITSASGGRRRHQQRRCAQQLVATDAVGAGAQRGVCGLGWRVAHAGAWLLGLPWVRGWYQNDRLLEAVILVVERPLRGLRPHRSQHAGASRRLACGGDIGWERWAGEGHFHPAGRFDPAGGFALCAVVLLLLLLLLLMLAVCCVSVCAGALCWWQV